MSKRGGGIPMSERVVRATSRPSTEDGCPARHCWVGDPVDESGVKRPALLVEWRRTTSGAWEGRVVYLARLRRDAWVMVEEWIPAAMLTTG
jgi:hypothetical protein